MRFGGPYCAFHPSSPSLCPDALCPRGQHTGASDVRLARVGEAIKLDGLERADLLGACEEAQSEVGVNVELTCVDMFRMESFMSNPHASMEAPLGHHTVEENARTVGRILAPGH